MTEGRGQAPAAILRAAAAAATAAIVEPLVLVLSNGVAAILVDISEQRASAYSESATGSSCRRIS